ncbi:unnamed protein product [Owenia fusiformis]|uniref:Vacuolar protein 8 n=1 Tax=Owenia fusiformis TaxID=6347 RepID=A0A8S4N2F2_OWEFU|nr:unnamed protein product [Owenia fusiformis]
MHAKLWVDVVILGCPIISGIQSFDDSTDGKSKKADVLDELVELLKRALGYCLCCITCGCIPTPHGHVSGDSYHDELMEEEKRAVQNLLLYLDSEENINPSINEERFRALCILTYSDNTELQRSAALCFAEFGERLTTPVSEVILEPLVVLLQSRDIQVQRAASLAMSNLAVYGPESNKMSIMKAGAIRPLVKLMYSNSLEVQCNVCGCITALTTSDKHKHDIVLAGGVKPLLNLARSKDIRVQRNATGALLNLTHLDMTREKLVEKGVIPVLVETLHSSDIDVQYYCAAALSNLAVRDKHRAMMVAVGQCDVIKQLLTLLRDSDDIRVICQSCLALRNLASDGDNQILITQLRGLQVLHDTVCKSEGETLCAALACLRNLSIHKANEGPIISETFVVELCKTLKDFSNPEAQCHAAGTIRNLGAGENIHALVVKGCIEALGAVILDPRHDVRVLTECTAALVVLNDEEVAKERTMGFSQGKLFSKMVYLASSSQEPEVQYNSAGAIGQLAVLGIPEDLLERNIPALFLYIEKFLNNPQPSYVHITLWTVQQLIKDDHFRTVYSQSHMLEQLDDILVSHHSEAIKELAGGILKQLHSTEHQEIEADGDEGFEFV